jgi:hypothetical protein
MLQRLLPHMSSLRPGFGQRSRMTVRILRSPALTPAIKPAAPPPMMIRSVDVWFILSFSVNFFLNRYSSATKQGLFLQNHEQQNH